jgi:hypothetical protein
MLGLGQQWLAGHRPTRQLRARGPRTWPTDSLQNTGWSSRYPAAAYAVLPPMPDTALRVVVADAEHVEAAGVIDRPRFTGNGDV